jgi:hypothetical protein
VLRVQTAAWESAPPLLRVGRLTGVLLGNGVPAGQLTQPSRLRCLWVAVLFAARGQEWIHETVRDEKDEDDAVRRPASVLRVPLAHQFTALAAKLMRAVAAHTTAATAATPVAVPLQAVSAAETELAGHCLTPTQRGDAYYLMGAAVAAAYNAAERVLLTRAAPHESQQPAGTVAAPLRPASATMGAGGSAASFQALSQAQHLERMGEDAVALAVGSAAAVGDAAADASSDDDAGSL